MSFHLKLTKGLSYSGIVSATKDKPDVYVDEKAIADVAVASGYFRVISPAEDVLTVAVDIMSKRTEDHCYTKEGLENMTLEQLKEIAAHVGVVETKGFKKADYVDAILWSEGDYSTGSTTMIDLQES